MIEGKIYGLYHPLTEELRYIGQTVSFVHKRLAQQGGA